MYLRNWSIRRVSLFVIAYLLNFLEILSMCRYIFIFIFYEIVIVSLEVFFSTRINYDRYFGMSQTLAILIENILDIALSSAESNIFKRLSYDRLVPSARTPASLFFMLRQPSK